jgi:exodeoxyribonuclease VIII
MKKKPKRKPSRMDRLIMPARGVTGEFMPLLSYEEYEKVPAVRSTTLKYALTSLAHYQAKRDSPSKETEALLMGKLLHMAVLEPGDFHTRKGIHIIPRGLDLRGKEGRAWKEEAKLRDPSGIPVKQERWEQIDGMRTSLYRNVPWFTTWKLRSLVEVSAWTLHAASNMKIKCRFDMLASDHDGRPSIVDLKTTGFGGAAPDPFGRQAFNLRYDIQDVLYTDIYEQLTAIRPTFTWVVIEKEEPYAVACYVLGEEQMMKAREDYTAALMAISRHEDSGDEYPGYPKEIQTIVLPTFGANRQKVLEEPVKVKALAPGISLERP